jgi:inosine/xanthosine triphosphate pyrophosphatase family protein
MMERNGLEYEKILTRNPTKFTELSDVLQEEIEVESRGESAE